jgi:hypothetical protein
MLSTQYRLKLEGICLKIVNGESVELNEMIWVEKLAKSNHSAASILRKARRRAANPDMVEGSMDDFLNNLDLGDPDIQNHRNGFESADEIVDFFKRNDVDDEENEGDKNWRRRD